MRAAVALALASLIALPSFAAAQSLAELAAREREKKKGKPTTTKVITEEELRRAGSGRGTANTSPSDPAASPAPGASPAAGAAAAAGADKQKPKTEEELRAEQEQAWRERLKKAQADAQRVAQELEAVNRNLGDVTGNLYGAQRTNLLAAAERLKGEQQTAQQQIAALEEEGRRSRFR